MASIQSPGVTKSTATIRPVRTGTAISTAVMRIRTYRRRLYGSSPIISGELKLMNKRVTSPMADADERIATLIISRFIIPFL